MPLFFSLDFTVGHEQCWAVLDFYEEPPVPFLVPQKMEFWVWFWKSLLVELELAVLMSQTG
jgi:hypothetical protein